MSLPPPYMPPRCRENGMEALRHQMTMTCCHWTGQQRGKISTIELQRNLQDNRCESKSRSSLKQMKRLHTLALESCWMLTSVSFLSTLCMTKCALCPHCSKLMFLDEQLSKSSCINSKFGLCCLSARLQSICSHPPLLSLVRCFWLSLA